MCRFFMHPAGKTTGRSYATRERSACPNSRRKWKDNYKSDAELEKDAASSSSANLNYYKTYEFGRNNQSIYGNTLHRVECNDISCKYSQTNPNNPYSVLYKRRMMEGTVNIKAADGEAKDAAEHSIITPDDSKAKATCPASNEVQGKTSI